MTDRDLYQEDLDVLLDDAEDTLDDDDWPDIVDLYREAMGETFPGGPS